MATSEPKKRSPWTIVAMVVGALAVLALVCGGGLVTGFGLGRGSIGLLRMRANANPYAFGMMPGGDWTMPYHRGQMPDMWGQPMPHDFGDEIPDGMMPRLAGAAYLGVTFAEVDAAQAEQEGLAAGEGALVATVIDGSPAADAGLRQGDIILEVDGQRVAQTAMLRRLVLAHAPGDAVTLLILRDGAEQSVQATLGEAADVQTP
jgi:membrane-associated protease RseP (regulator of RpoE activity)